MITKEVQPREQPRGGEGGIGGNGEGGSDGGRAGVKQESL